VLAPMNIRKSFEILELDHAATEEEARQAYKDIVNVWHPDRFSSNPRLKQRAENKLKEVNAAYETVKDFFQKCKESNTRFTSQANGDSKQASDKRRSSVSETDEVRTKTEIAAEVGTAIVLGFYSYVSKKVRNMFEKSRPG
jgi:curved DNA-binding protein CbpA